MSYKEIRMKINKFYKASSRSNVSHLKLLQNKLTATLEKDFKVFKIYPHIYAYGDSSNQYIHSLIDRYRLSILKI